ncbi:uncharacterized protein LOC134234829 [Saccostrea cucullata]|uniref:uncharacterized protein LOC134234829 n=1 Tax=Saccostrea cuccullata TaxID=36930 RepID=UPI002ED24CC5
MEEQFLRNAKAEENDSEICTCSRNDAIVKGDPCPGCCHRNEEENIQSNNNKARFKSSNRRVLKEIPIDFSSRNSRCLLVLSVLSVICFCPTGIFAVITAAKLQKARKLGNGPMIEKLTSRTRMLVSMSMGIWIVILVFCLIIYFVNIFGIRSYFT